MITIYTHFVLEGLSGHRREDVERGYLEVEFYYSQAMLQFQHVHIATGTFFLNVSIRAGFPTLYVSISWKALRCVSLLS